MSIIRVNPESIQSYSRAASGQFDQMRASLDALVRDVVEVRYFGPNAQQFKTECGTLAVEFSNAMINDLRQIAEAVRSSTTAISASLGGGAVSIQFDGSPVAAPSVPPASDVVDLDTSALEGLQPMVTGHFSTIQEALTAHLGSLQGTDWEGTAKMNAVDTVSTFTTAARSKATEAQTNINRAISDQISSAVAADR
ncbi:MAG: hypothetical protein JJT89_10155 [Nitriliruptoraceae bacterium]|nr:hypothetical protein [Nitriliruptoraceae bacterium]